MKRNLIANVLKNVTVILIIVKNGDSYIYKYSKIKTKKEDNTCSSGWEIGTVLFQKDGMYYLPEDDEILKELDEDPNL